MMAVFNDAAIVLIISSLFPTPSILYRKPEDNYLALVWINLYKKSGKPCMCGYTIMLGYIAFWLRLK